jgi:hypothetical protein
MANAKELAERARMFLFAESGQAAVEGLGLWAGMAGRTAPTQRSSALGHHGSRSVGYRAILPPLEEHITAKGARWYLPRGIQRVRILHRPKDEVLHILLGPFLGNGG